MAGHCFISYSTVDALDFARKLANKLVGGMPNIPVWFDKDDLKPSMDWDIQIDDALKSCRMVLFVMTKDSTHDKSVCRQEWSRALSYKKPIVPLWVENDINVPFRLADRQRVDFRKSFDVGLAQLRDYLAWLDSPEGILQGYKDRLLDAERDLQRARDEDKARIQLDIEELTKQIETQQKIVENPKAAQEQTQKNIEAGLERERQPAKPTAAQISTRFINPPPGIAPTYFQDRLIETKQIADFLNNDAQRLMTIVGRAGVGKTAMICRLLKGIENGKLPDELGDMKADGIVYLSEAGSHRVNFANIFVDLNKLLPNETAAKLEGLYKDPQTPTGDKMRNLLDTFGGGRFILLLDNFENLIDSESLHIKDSELSDALNSVLQAPQHTVKVIITTRIAPRDLALVEPGRQHPLSLDDGLESPYAENVLREMDKDGRVGLKSASNPLLNKAREKTRGYPRALEALYAILSVDRYTTLEELLSLNLPKEVVEKLVGEAFNRLDPTAQKVMEALAIYNRPVSPAAIDYLLQLHLPGIDSARVLNRLVNMHFARREAGKYYLHPADREYALSSIPVFESETGFTQRDLTLRAADYFAQARKPAVEWKRLDDLAAQMAEFDLRCVAGDYDTAASALTDLAYDSLLLWGHYRLMIGLHDKLRGKLADRPARLKLLRYVGRAYSDLAEFGKALELFEQALTIAREIGDRTGEEAALRNIGVVYWSLRENRLALEFYEQALMIAREIGDRESEARSLVGIGNVMEEKRKALGFYELALTIAREIGNRELESSSLNNTGFLYSYWGEKRKAFEFFEQALTIAREIGDRRGEGIALGNIANVYSNLGEKRKALEFFEQALTIAREIDFRALEAGSLFGIGIVYSNLEENHKALEFFEQALTIAREIGSWYRESACFANMGHALLLLEEFQKADENYQKAIQIADEKSNLEVQQNARTGLALAYLFQNEFDNARTTIEAALQYAVQESNHNATALHGIIALRQGERETAQEAFTKSIAQADEILAKTPEFYSALDAKGLALCGLAICDDKKYITEAIETFRAARKIAPHAGVVKSVLRLFDELVKCDEDGILKDVRKAIEEVA